MFLRRLIASKFSAFIGASTILLLSSCAPQVPTPSVSADPSIVASDSSKNAAPIIPPVKSDVIFAQASLKKLGYKIGFVDGLWGPRSAQAIIEFEKDQKLETANGRLSELNLAKLASLSGIERDADIQTSVQASTQVNTPKPLEIAKKLSELQAQKEDGPRLIIVDKTFKVLSKPNPFSSELSSLSAGTGIYVLTQLEDNWYEIESINRLKGFIQDY